MNIIHSNTSRPVYTPVQVTYIPMTKLELVQSATMTDKYLHTLDCAGQAYWCKESSRTTLINELVEIALEFIPSHLDLSKLVRRQANQDFRLRIA